MSDEEKEIFNNLKEYMQSEIDNGYHKFIYNDLDWDFKCIDCINAIDNALKQSKEIEHQKEKRENQKRELAILNAKQIEFNKLVNTVNSYKGQFKRQQKELEELKEDNKHQWEERCKLTFELENSTSNDKIKAKVNEVKDRPVKDEFITASQGKLNTIIDIESLLD